ncbi:putative zinc-binding metallopeptidase [Alishewanella longhuensis]
MTACSSVRQQSANLATISQLQALNRQAAVSITLDVGAVQLAPWDLSFNAVTAADPMLLAYLQMLEQELRKLPLDIIQASGLEVILLVRDLAVAGQARLAVPDYVHEVLLYDISHKDMDFNRHVFHHEFYHMLEEQLYGSAYYADPLWQQLNPDSFQYGDGGANARASFNTLLSHPAPGFVNRYAMAGIEEDKAELWAILWTDTSWRQSQGMLQHDAVLRNKFKLLLQQLSCVSADIINSVQHRLKDIALNVNHCPTDTSASFKPRSPEYEHSLSE